MRRLVWTGAIAGAAAAVVLPPAFELASGGFAAEEDWLRQYVVISAFVGLAAAPIWGLIGALAGCLAGLIWRRQDQIGRRSTYTWILTLTGALMGAVTGCVVGLLAASLLGGIAVGGVVAVIAAGVAGLTLRRVSRADRRRRRAVHAR